MDNFYSSLILFLKLRVREDTLATGTLRPRKGVPKEVLHTCIHVNLLSTGRNYKLISTGKRHYQTREILSKTRIVHPTIHFRIHYYTL